MRSTAYQLATTGVPPSQSSVPLDTYLIVCGGEVLGVDVHHKPLSDVLLEASEFLAGLVQHRADCIREQIRTIE